MLGICSIAAEQVRMIRIKMLEVSLGQNSANL